MTFGLSRVLIDIILRFKPSPERAFKNQCTTNSREMAQTLCVSFLNDEESGTGYLVAKVIIVTITRLHCIFNSLSMHIFIINNQKELSAL